MIQGQNSKVKGQKFKSKFKTFEFLIASLTFAFCLLNFHVALAQSSCAEVPLPLIGTGGIDPCSSPAAYVAYWFYFALYLSGIFALLIFVIGGVMYMMSGIMSTTQKATKMMQDAVLGMILLFGSFLFLKTLNPALTVIQNPPPFGLLSGCFASFIPKSIPVTGTAKLFWTVANKDVAEVIRVCTDDKNTLVPSPTGNSSVQAIGNGEEYRSNNNRPGSITCLIKGDNRNKAKIEECSATLSIQKACNLTWNIQNRKFINNTIPVTELQLSWNIDEADVEEYSLRCGGQNIIYVPTTRFGSPWVSELLHRTQKGISWQIKSPSGSIACTVDIGLINPKVPIINACQTTVNTFQ